MQTILNIQVIEEIFEGKSWNLGKKLAVGAAKLEKMATFLFPDLLINNDEMDVASLVQALAMCFWISFLFFFSFFYDFVKDSIQNNTTFLVTSTQNVGWNSILIIHTCHTISCNVTFLATGVTVLFCTWNRMNSHVWIIVYYYRFILWS